MKYAAKIQIFIQQFLKLKEQYAGRAESAVGLLTFALPEAPETVAAASSVSALGTDRAGW